MNLYPLKFFCINIISPPRGKHHLDPVYVDTLCCRVYMHRYRDTDPDIRLACISFLGSWIYKYPSYYLTDQYLKYIGWMLNDKVSL